MLYFYWKFKLGKPVWLFEGVRVFDRVEYIVNYCFLDELGYRCCKKVRVSATSRMLDFQSDAVGIYEATGGRMVSW